MRPSRSITPPKSCSSPMGSWTGPTWVPNAFCSSSSVRSNEARSRSSLLTKNARGTPASTASSQTTSCWTSTPSTADTTKTQQSAARIGALHVADEVRVPGRVEDVDLDAVPLDRRHGQRDADAAVDLLGIVVRHGVAVLDLAHPGERPGREQHGLEERRLARCRCGRPAARCGCCRARRRSSRPSVASCARNRRCSRRRVSPGDSSRRVFPGRLRPRPMANPRIRRAGSPARSALLGLSILVRRRGGHAAPDRAPRGGRRPGRLALHRVGCFARRRRDRQRRAPSALGAVAPLVRRGDPRADRVDVPDRRPAGRRARARHARAPPWSPRTSGRGPTSLGLPDVAARMAAR